MSKVILHQWNISPYCAKIRKVLEFKKINFVTKDYNGLLALQAGKLTEVGKLPVLEINGQMIQDSREITKYLESNFPEHSLRVNDPSLDSQVHLLEDWADESLYWYEIYFRFVNKESFKRAWSYICEGRPLWEKLILAKPVRKQYIAAVKSQGLGKYSEEFVVSRFEKHLDSLNQRLKDNEYLVGDKKTIADIAVASQLQEIHRTNPIGAKYSNYPKLAQWLEKV
jgi:glutathione S-transferase